MIPPVTPPSRGSLNVTFISIVARPCEKGGRQEGHTRQCRKHHAHVHRPQQHCSCQPSPHKTQASPPLPIPTTTVNPAAPPHPHDACESRSPACTQHAAHLELRQVGILGRDLKGEALHHRLLCARRHAWLAIKDMAPWSERIECRCAPSAIVPNPSSTCCHALQAGPPRTPPSPYPPSTSTHPPIFPT